MGQKRQLEGSVKLSEERAKIADGKVNALQRELKSLRSAGFMWVRVSLRSASCGVYKTCSVRVNT